MTIVHNDPVNLMSYVTWVFQKLFGYSREKAEKLMLDVHHKGTGDRVQRHARADGARRVPAARVRPLGHGGPVVTMFARRGSRCASRRLDAVEAAVLHEVLIEVIDAAVGEASTAPIRWSRGSSRTLPARPGDLGRPAPLHRGRPEAAKLEQAGAVLDALPRGGGAVRARRGAGRGLAAGAHRRPAGARACGWTSATTPTWRRRSTRRCSPTPRRRGWSSCRCTRS